ncbi:unnamed protein product [Allacma fusca]|uniref:Uncharacterized protein n=1 Tax=Allacma fusca TaxID=39272 RepID=A0A8J2KPG4_9HEXA|nr:unnamed protein product [Allacma fusca]
MSPTLKFPVVILALTALALLHPCSGATIDLFDDENHKGYITSLEVGNSCVNLGYGKKLVSSVDTHGDCVLLYKLVNCKGDSVRVAPGTQHHNDLNMLDINDAVVSLIAC